MIRFYNVFNADQVEGYEAETGLEQGTLGTVQKIKTIETFVAQTKAVIETGNVPAFLPELDYIEIPDSSLFFDHDQSATENYYAVMLHELTH